MHNVFPKFQIGFLTISLLDIIDILAVTYVFYYLYLLMRKTRAVQMFIGLMVIFLVSFLAQALNMQELSWIFRNLSTVWLVAFIIIFQPELRRILTIMGQNRFVRIFSKTQPSLATEEIVKAVFELSRRGHGALIVLVRRTGLRTIVETGIRLEALVNASLIVSIFNPRSPLHDGAIIIQNDMIEAAKCILPLSKNPQAEERWGTRHRAALGLSEESDALIITVSEVTGIITVFQEGEVKEIKTHKELLEILNAGILQKVESVNA